VARIVLDAREGEAEALARGRVRLHLAAILPMEEAAYKATFDGTGCASREASLAEFDALYRRANVQAVLPPPRPGSPEAAAPQTTTLAFERMASFLAWHAHVLLALWNGQSRRPGRHDRLGGVVHGRLHAAFAPGTTASTRRTALLLLRVHTRARSRASRPSTPRSSRGDSTRRGRRGSSARSRASTATRSTRA
jgi:hypothetical protein